MTSSLVGSEMCIRDSMGERETTAGMALTKSKNQWAMQKNPILIRQDRPGPVSYTHLTLPTICSV
eukprot:8062144-Prorocentrum_lima.AAC.1